MDVKHAATFGFFSNRVLCLLFGADEKHMTARRGQITHHGFQLLEHRHSLLQVDNMYAITGAKNVGLHLRVPTACLVAEMNTGLQKLFHRNIAHNLLLLLVLSSPFFISESNLRGTSTRIGKGVNF